MPLTLFAPSSLREKKDALGTNVRLHLVLSHRLIRGSGDIRLPIRELHDGHSVARHVSRRGRTCRGRVVGAGSLSRRRDGVHGPRRKARCPRGVSDHAGRRACGHGARHVDLLQRIWRRVVDRREMDHRIRGRCLGLIGLRARGGLRGSRFAARRTRLGQHGRGLGHGGRHPARWFRGGYFLLARSLSRPNTGARDRGRTDGANAYRSRRNSPPRRSAGRRVCSSHSARHVRASRRHWGAKQAGSPL